MQLLTGIMAAGLTLGPVNSARACTTVLVGKDAS